MKRKPICQGTFCNAAAAVEKRSETCGEIGCSEAFTGARISSTSNCGCGLWQITALPMCMISGANCSTMFYSLTSLQTRNAGSWDCHCCANDKGDDLSGHFPWLSQGGFRISYNNTEDQTFAVASTRLSWQVGWLISEFPDPKPIWPPGLRLECSGCCPFF